MSIVTSHDELPIRVRATDLIAIAWLTSAPPADAENFPRIIEFVEKHGARPLLMFDINHVPSTIPCLLDELVRLHRCLTQRGTRVVFCGLRERNSPLISRLRTRSIRAFVGGIDQRTLLQIQSGRIARRAAKTDISARHVAGEPVELNH